MKASYRLEPCCFDNSKIACYFLINGKPDFDCHGTNGTGLKIYDNCEKADNAGKRYLKKMKGNGFEI